MATRIDALYCPACGDTDFYSCAPLPAGAFQWMIDIDGVVSVRQGSEDLAVLTPIRDAVFCSGCHAPVTGTAAARASVRHH